MNDTAYDRMGTPGSGRGGRLRQSGRGLIVLTIVGVLGPGACVVHGQQTSLEAIGVPPFTQMLPVENGYINPTNGDLHLEIPLGTFAERGGRQFKAALMYDSNIWGTGAGAFGPGNVPDGNGRYCYIAETCAGWRLITSGSTGGAHYNSTDMGYCPRSGLTDKVEHNAFYYVAPDGTVHTFNSIITWTYISCTYPYTQTGGSGDGVANDESGYHMYVTNGTQATVYGPDGTRYVGPEDSNGNYSTWAASSYIDGSETDTLGRNILTRTTNGNQIYYDILNSQGTTSRYTVTMETVNVWSNFGANDYHGTLSVIQSIQLPDGTSYSFQYDAGTVPGHYGLLSSMRLPTGGQISYSYTNFTQPQCVVNTARVIASRTTPDSSTAWSYSFSPQNSPQCVGQFTVTKPNGDNEVYTLTPAPGVGSGRLPLETQLQFYNGAVSPANLLATLTQSFDTSNGKGFLKTADTTTLPGPGGTTLSQTNQYSWDNGGYGGSSQYGQLLQTREWNFYSGSLPASPDRTTAYTYLGGSGSGYLNSNANILDRRTSIAVTNSNGATVAKTANCYDYIGGCGGTSFADAGSVTNHDAAYGPSNTFRGDLTQVQKLISGTSNYLTKSMSYDTTGQLLTETDWSNLSTHQTSYSYTDHYVNDNTTNSEPLAPYSPSQATDGYPTTVTAPISTASMTYTYYYGTGQKSSATDANGKTSYSHFGDPLDRPTSTKQPNGGWSYFLYTGANTIDKGTAITSPTLSISCTGNGDCRHDQTHLDGLARADHQYLVSDPDGQTSVDTAYDSNGRAYSVSNPHRTGSFTTDGTELYPSHDGLDRKLQITRADGSVEYTYYGPTVSSNGGRSSQLCSGYGLGYPVLNTDEAGHKRQSWTDGFGRLIEVDEPDSTNTLSVGTCYAYDLNNNLIGVRSLGGSESTCTLNGATYNRCFTYDMTSRLLTAYNPEAGTITYAYDQDTNCPTPNSFPGQLVSKTDARLKRACIQYDALNRVTQVNYSDSTPTVTYSYDSTNCLEVSPCYNLGHQTGMTDGSGQTNWSYDAVGNVLEEKRTIGTVTKNILYSYNLDSSTATIAYPSGRVLTYQVGDAQRPVQVVDSAHAINYATGAHYAPPGELASLTNGGSFSYTSIYNSRLQPCWAYATTGTALPWNSTNCNGSASTGSVLDMKYAFNVGSGDNGNVIGITNNRDSTRSEAFTYDNLNRLSTAQTTSTYSASPTNCWAEKYTIDPVGNLTSISASGNSNYNGCVQESGTSLSVTGNNQISGFCYDAGGNLQAQSPSPCPSPTYVYDAESRLSSANGVSYSYDGDGRRVKKSSGTLYWYGTASDPIAETDASGNTTNEYIFFGGKRIARQDASNHTFYYFADRLGTAREIIQAGSTIPCYDADFYPFGGERVVVDTCDSHYKFTGKERDTESGLDNFGARYDSSQYGRFMTPDWSAKPMGVPYAQLGDPQSLNLYAYVENNPIGRADPDGHNGLTNWLYNFFVGSGDAPPSPPPPPPPGEMEEFTYTPAPQQQSTQKQSQSLAGKAAALGKAMLHQGMENLLHCGGAEMCTTGVPGPPGVGAIGAAARAGELADALGTTKDFVTIAVTETEEGVTVVSSSENALRPAVAAALKEGEVAVEGAGHAEVTGINGAKALGLTPTGTAASRGICQGCWDFMKAATVEALSALKRGVIP